MTIYCHIIEKERSIFSKKNLSLCLWDKFKALFASGLGREFRLMVRVFVVLSGVMSQGSLIMDLTNSLIWLADCLKCGASVLAKAVSAL